MTFKLTFYNFLKTKEEKGSSIYNMRSFYLIFLIIQTIISQENKIDSEKLWEGDYEPKRLESILSMKDDNHYTVLEQNAELNRSLIILNSFINKKKSVVLFDSKKFSDNLEISSYSFSKDEQNLLLETHSDPIYRRSKQGVYWIYNLKSKELQKLTDEKVQEPTFSPDGKNVAYVYRRNIYVKNLITKATMQLTFDGDYQTINGITDWVYEEEFGLFVLFIGVLILKKLSLCVLMNLRFLYFQWEFMGRILTLFHTCLDILRLEKQMQLLIFLFWN